MNGRPESGVVGQGKRRIGKHAWRSKGSLGSGPKRYWKLFATEIEGVFCPQLQQDWAHNALKKLKQTDTMSMVTFNAEFMKLKYYAKTDDSAAIRYLEDNVHPHIRYQLFSMG